MTTEEEREKEDKILVELNKRLDEEKQQEEREKEISDEVEKRLEERKPRDATFEDKKGKKVKVKRKKEKEPEKHNCPKCGGELTTRLDDGQTIGSYRGEVVSEVWYCHNCKKRLGVVKE